MFHHPNSPRPGQLWVLKLHGSVVLILGVGTFDLEVLVLYDDLGLFPVPYLDKFPKEFLNLFPQNECFEVPLEEINHLLPESSGSSP